MNYFGNQIGTAIGLKFGRDAQIAKLEEQQRYNQVQRQTQIALPDIEITNTGRRIEQGQQIAAERGTIYSTDGVRLVDQETGDVLPDARLLDYRDTIQKLLIENPQT